MPHADEHELLPNLQFLYSFASWTTSSKPPAKSDLDGLFSAPGSFVRKSWNLVAPVQSSERVTSFLSVQMSLIMSVSLPHDVNVLK